MEYIDLVTDSGELIRVECPDEHLDQCYDSLDFAMKRGGWWSPIAFDGCSAQYLGLPMSRVAMRKIVGFL